METSYNYKAEEQKKYLKYFMVWIILAVLSSGIFGVLFLTHKDEEPVEVTRNNDVAPTQRVYDEADVLTDQEEESLEKLIAEYEERGKCDIVLVTIREYVAEYDEDWESIMMNWADDIYDKGQYGYDKPFGDGVLLLDNWYHYGEHDSQAGYWISTSGKMEYAYDSSADGSVLRAYNSGLSISPYEAYARALEKLAYYAENYEQGEFRIPWILVLIIPVVVAAIYAASNMHQTPGKDTTTATTYVPGGTPGLKVKRDDFIRKNVTKVKIETDSSRSGGGGYGHHVSSGGHSHGGSGHRR